MLRVAEAVHRTDVGRQREANEDSFFSRAPVFAVADGMGGAQAGEVASRIAVAAFEPELPEDAGPGALAARDRAARQPRDLRPRPGRHLALGHGHDADRGARRRRRGLLRPRRRFARLPAARRRAQPAHQRPLARRGAAPPGQADQGAGGRAPAALGHHPRARAGARRRRRHDDRAGSRRRRLPALQRRADDDDLRRGRARGAEPLRQPRRGRAEADPRRQRARRPRQHHRHPLPARGRRRRAPSRRARR